MKKTTHCDLIETALRLEYLSERVLFQINAETTPMWRNLFERMHVQIARASSTLVAMADLVPPAGGGNSPDPWQEPLGCGLSSLEVLDVFQRAQRLRIDIRQFSFDELRKLVAKNNVLTC